MRQLCRQHPFHQPGPAFPAMKQYDNAASRIADDAQGLVQIPGVGIILQIEKVHDRKGLMHSYQGFIVGSDRPLYQRQVDSIDGLVQVGNELESAVRALEGTFYNPFHQAFRTAAIMDEVGYRTYLELMLCRK